MGFFGLPGLAIDQRRGYSLADFTVLPFYPSSITYGHFRLPLAVRYTSTNGRGEQRRRA